MLNFPLAFDSSNAARDWFVQDRFLVRTNRLLCGFSLRFDLAFKRARHIAHVLSFNAHLHFVLLSARR
jgi:hypothetical protein